MKYKTQLRVLLKAIGVLLIGQGCFHLVNAGGSLVALIITNMGPTAGGVVGTLFAANVQIGLGLYLFLGGKWVADKAIPAGRPYCRECGNDLTGMEDNLCPECDTPFNPDAVRPSGMHQNADNIA